MAFGGDNSGVVGGGVGQGLGQMGQNLADQYNKGVERKENKQQKDFQNNLALLDRDTEEERNAGQKADALLEQMRKATTEAERAGIYAQWQAITNQRQHLAVRRASRLTQLDPKYATQTDAEGNSVVADAYGMAGFKGAEGYANSIKEGSARQQKIEKVAAALETAKQKAIEAAKADPDSEVARTAWEEYKQLDGELKTLYGEAFGKDTPYVTALQDPAALNSAAAKLGLSNIIRQQLDAYIKSGGEHATAALALLKQYPTGEIPENVTLNGVGVLKFLRDSTSLESIQKHIDGGDYEKAGLALMMIGPDKLKDAPAHLKALHAAIMDPKLETDPNTRSLADSIRAKVNINPALVRNYQLQGDNLAITNERATFDLARVREMAPVERSKEASAAALRGDRATLALMAPMLREDLGDKFDGAWEGLMKQVERKERAEIASIHLAESQAKGSDLANDSATAKLVNGPDLAILDQLGQTEGIQKAFNEKYGDLGPQMYKDAVARSQEKLRDADQTVRDEAALRAEQLTSLRQKNAFDKEIHPLLIEEQKGSNAERKARFEHWVENAPYITQETAANAMSAAAKAYGPAFYRSDTAKKIAEKAGITPEQLESRARYEEDMMADEATKNKHTQLLQLLADPETALGAESRVRDLAGQLGMNPDRVMQIVNRQSNRTVRMSDAQLKDLLHQTYARGKTLSNQDRDYWLDLRRQRFNEKATNTQLGMDGKRLQLSIDQFDYTRADDKKNFDEGVRRFDKQYARGVKESDRDYNMRREQFGKNYALNLRQQDFSEASWNAEDTRWWTSFNEGKRQFEMGHTREVAKDAWQVINDIEGRKLGYANVSVQQMQALAGERMALQGMVGDGIAIQQNYQKELDQITSTDPVVKNALANQLIIQGKNGEWEFNPNVVPKDADIRKHPGATNYINAANGKLAAQAQTERYRGALDKVIDTYNKAGDALGNDNFGSDGGGANSNIDLTQSAASAKTLAALKKTIPDGPTGDVVRTAIQGLSDKNFVSAQRYCTKFVRQVVEKSLGMPDGSLGNGKLFSNNATTTYSKFKEAGLTTPLTNPGQLQDGSAVFIIYPPIKKADGTMVANPDDHIAIYAGSGMVIHNSLYKDNKTDGAKGYGDVSALFADAKKRGGQMFQGSLDPNAIAQATGTNPRPISGAPQNRPGAPAGTPKASAPAAAPQKPTSGQSTPQKPTTVTRTMDDLNGVKVPSGSYRTMPNRATNGFVQVPNPKGGFYTFLNKQGADAYTSKTFGGFMDMARKGENGKTWASASVQDRRDMFVQYMENSGLGGDLERIARQYIK